jgi:toxin ParE1/3/4
MAQVTWTFQAMEDLADINAFLSQNSEKYADFVTSAIFSITEQLQEFPYSGRIVPEMRIDIIREVVVAKYRIVYQIVSNDKINILTVRHSSKPFSAY